MAFALDVPSLFKMGFADDAVGRALVEAKGDAKRALEILKVPSAGPPPPRVEMDQALPAETMIEPATGEQLSEEEQLELAIQMSLRGSAKTGSDRDRRLNEAATSSAPTSNPLWAPPRYLPAEGADALRVHGGQTLSLVEDIEVRDGGYSWQRGKAFLDTGNQHMTIIDRRFAARHAIYGDTPAFAGSSLAERWTTLHGVVPGASSSAPVVTIALKLRGEEFTIQAAVSDMGGRHDLLLGVDVLGRMFASGFRIGNGSM